MNSGREGTRNTRPVRPEADTKPTRPSTVNMAAGSDKGRDMEERAEELVRRITELEEKIIREEGRRPIVSPVPERPPEEELREHNVTHTPPKVWCPYCTMASA